MAKPKAKKAQTFQNTMTRAVFLTGNPNKQKAVLLESCQRRYTEEINRFIGLIAESTECLPYVINGSSRAPFMRRFEKAARSKDMPATYSQAAFDDACVKLTQRMDGIRSSLYELYDGFLASGKLLLGMVLTGRTREEMLAALQALVDGMKHPAPRYSDWMQTLREMDGEAFDTECREIRFLYQCISDGCMLPAVRRAEVRLVSTNMKFALTDKIAADAVISISLPGVKGYLDIPLRTSRNSIRRLKQYGACHSAAYTIREDGQLRVSAAFRKQLAAPVGKSYQGVDVGITDALHASEAGAIGSLKDAVDFYKTAVEPGFAELSALRNKKRKLCRYLAAHPDVPDEVRSRIRSKVDRLDSMLSHSEKAYRRNRHYKEMLQHTVKQSVSAYIDSLNGDRSVVTVLEKLDIREFNRSKRENGRYSLFARGMLSQKLMDTLNWNGYAFLQVDPAYTSQTCPVCSLTAKENRNAKAFVCTCCGYRDDADHNGAVNIRARAEDTEILDVCAENLYRPKQRQFGIKRILDRRHQIWLSAHPSVQ